MLKSYIGKLVIIFFFANGLLYLDRMALSILVPVMIDDIGLTTSQVGQVTMFQTIGYALAAPLVALFAEKLKRRKEFLVLALFLTGIFTALTLFASSYQLLLIIRTLLGIVEGGILPLILTFVVISSAKNQFAKNVAIVYLGSAVIGSTLGPIILTQLTSVLDWKTTYLMISIPTIIVSILLWFIIKNDNKEEVASKSSTDKPQIAQIFKNRNIVLCMIIGVFHMGAAWNLMSFGPLYFTTLGGFSVENMGIIMSIFGLVVIAWTYFIPFVSDYIGRKKALIGSFIIGMIVPLSLYAFPSSMVSIIAFVALGGSIIALISMYSNIIPGESINPTLLSFVIGLITCISEFVGAFGVGVSGALSDKYGLQVIMILTAVFCILGAAISLLLKETHKVKVYAKEEIIVNSAQIID